MESYQRKIKMQHKQTAVFNQILAMQIKQEMIPLLVEKIPEDYKKLQLWDFFPNLFEEEKKVYETKTEEEEFEKFKEKRRQFAMQHNKRMNRGDDS